MIRTAAVALPLTLFVAWCVHVVNLAGNGPGLQWNRIPNNVSFTAALTGVPYVAFVIIALLVLYFTRLRGNSRRVVVMAIATDRAWIYRP